MSVQWNNMFEVVKHSEDVDTEKQQWYLQLKPTKAADMIGNEQQRQQLHEWMTDTNTGRVAVVHGACGTGKSTSVRMTAEACGLGVVHLLVDEHHSAVQISGAYRKAECSNSIVFVDDIHALASHSPTAYAYLIKLLKNTAVYRTVRTVCCYDSDLLQYSKLSNLMGIMNMCEINFEAVSEAAIQSYVMRVCRLHKVEVTYFDALFIAQKANGDVRAALVEIEWLFVTRKLKATINKKKQQQTSAKSIKICADMNTCSMQSLPTLARACHCMVRNTGNSSAIAEAVAGEGVDYAHAVADHVSLKYLQHMHPETDLQCAVRITESLSDLDIQLDRTLVDAEAADDLRDAQMTAYAFRPQGTVSHLRQALLHSQQCTEIMSALKRTRRTRLQYNS